MGNSNRRGSSGSNLVVTSSTVGTVGREQSGTGKNVHIDERQLAPKVLNESNNNPVECPICFISYKHFNSVSCCKQIICTDCFVQLKRGSSISSCPFCSSLSFDARYQVDESIAHVSDVPSKSTSTSVPSSTYLTPEQTKKLRSLSTDLTSTMSSRSDREELEAQIRKQRLDFDEEEYQSAFPSLPQSTANQSNQRRINNRRNHHSQSHNTRGTRLAPSSRQSSPPFLFDDEDSDGNSDPQTDSVDQFISAWQNIVEQEDMEQFFNLESLEEIMLMEAIRQSMLESSSAKSEPQPISSLPQPPSMCASESLAIPAPATVPRSEMDGLSYSAATDRSSRNSSPKNELDGLELEAFNTILQISPGSNYNSPPRSPLKLLEEIETVLNSTPYGKAISDEEPSEK